MFSVLVVWEYIVRHFEKTGAFKRDHRNLIYAACRFPAAWNDSLIGHFKW
jgi:hypothetical protein